jgi:hypothetical protein
MLTLAGWLLGCEPSPDSADPHDSDTDGMPNSCTDNHLPDDLEAAATYLIRGTPNVDRHLGSRTSVGDIDGDGLDDIAMTGAYSPYAYLVLGAALLAHPPGTYDIDDVADFRFELEDDESGTYSYGAYAGWDSTILVEPGVLFIGNPVEPAKPMAYALDWGDLERIGPGHHRLRDVASTAFEGSRPIGTSLVRCDINGDGERDLLVGSRYLLLGPLPDRDRIDVDAEATILKDVAHGAYVGGMMNRFGIQACQDVNHDGFDDLLVSWGQVVVYYGSADAGASTFFDLETGDVTVVESSPEEERYLGVDVTPESIGDWNGDGDLDLIVSRGEVRPFGSRVFMFLGGPDFFPSGTELVPDTDSYLSVRNPEGHPISLGAGVSLRGDFNDDGRSDLVLGEPRGDGGGVGTGGRIYLRYCPAESGDSVIDAFAEQVYEGRWVEDQTASLGGTIVASGDIDGDGRSDLLLPIEYANADPGGIYIIVQ